VVDLTALIKKTIAEKKPDDLRTYIGASSIGHKCNRFLWYQLKGLESDQVPSNIQITFDIGKKLESLILNYLEKSGLNIVRPETSNNFLFYQDIETPIFQGHADAVLLSEYHDPIIIEIKTAKNSSFSKFVKHGLKAWNEIYYAQLQAYMGMSGYKQSILLALNKDSSELHHECVDYDNNYYNELKTKAKIISECNEPPPKINNNAIFLICNRCKFKKVCHG
jgi:CRISPR/Cas system-associated exonuclease Cas4 (RecB family)